MAAASEEEEEEAPQALLTAWPEHELVEARALEAQDLVLTQAS